MANIQTKALLATFISSVIWGGAFISAKVLVDYLSPITMVFARYGIATIFLFLLMKIKEPQARLERQDCLRMWITGMLGINVSFYLTSIALQTITASTSGVINGTIPVFTLLAEIVFFHKKVSCRSFVGVLGSTLGVFLIVTGGNANGFNSLTIGYLYITLGILSWVAYTFLTESLFTKYSSLVVITYQSLLASLSLLPLVLVKKNFVTEFSYICTERIVLQNLLFLGVVSSALAYYAYNYGLAHLGVAKTAIFMNFTPAVSMFGGYFVLGEEITWFKSVGLIMVILSVYLVSTENDDKKKKIPKATLPKKLVILK